MTQMDPNLINNNISFVDYMIKTVHSAINLGGHGTNGKVLDLKDDDNKDSPLTSTMEQLDTTKYMRKDTDVSKLIPVQNMYTAYKKMRHIVIRTPTQLQAKLSERYQAKIYLKREDLQIVRSYKLRGAYNKITSIPESERHRGVVCASAGNHAQGVAYVCELLKIKSTIFMPTSTPAIKKNAVQQWGKEYADIQIIGDTFDDSFKAAQLYCQQHGKIFVHAFDDAKVIEGQASIAVEILEDIPDDKVDFMIFPVGGGGCGSGISSYFKQVSPETILIGCQPSGAPSMKIAIQEGQVKELKSINTFVDGAAIQKAGVKTHEILTQCLSDIILVPEGHVCTTTMMLFNECGILTEPAGALSVAALDYIKDDIKGKTVVCLISGSNNDLGRMQDIRMLSEMHRGLQYYLLVNFYQKPGALKQFLTECLGPSDEITNIEYTRKNNREKGPALVGIKVQRPEDFEAIKRKMEEMNITYKFINPDQEIFKLLL